MKYFAVLSFLVLYAQVLWAGLPKEEETYLSGDVSNAEGVVGESEINPSDWTKGFQLESYSIEDLKEYIYRLIEQKKYAEARLFSLRFFPLDESAKVKAEFKYFTAYSSMKLGDYTDSILKLKELQELKVKNRDLLVLSQTLFAWTALRMGNALPWNNWMSDEAHKDRGIRGTVAKAVQDEVPISEQMKKELFRVSRLDVEGIRLGIKDYEGGLPFRPFWTMGVQTILPGSGDVIMGEPLRGLGMLLVNAVTLGSAVEFGRHGYVFPTAAAGMTFAFSYFYSWVTAYQRMTYLNTVYRENVKDSLIQVVVPELDIRNISF